MGESTKIEWADHTWSPWIGCTKIAPACDGCYAAHLMDTRLGRVEWGPHGERKRTSADYWRQLARWDAAARREGRIATVFPSLCDPFDNAVDPTLRREWFETIRAHPNLLWLLLTKRPQNIVSMVKEICVMPANVAFGATCEDRTRVKQNLPHLVVAAGLRPRFLFVSAEPLLGDLGDLSPWLRGDRDTQNLRDGEHFESGIKIGASGWPISPAIGWVITGGETDQGQHKARPTHPAWIRSIRDQCAAHGTPYLHKQSGEWAGTHPDWPRATPTVMAADGTLYGATDLAYPDGPRRGEAIRAGHDTAQLTCVYRVGKKAAGRLLDGVEHNGFPEMRAHG